jgi:hypothetical protein
MANNTLLLSQSAWDLVLDARGNIAMASEPYSLAQDAASAIKLFLGEYYWNTALGVPYLTKIFGKNPSLSSLKDILAAAAASASADISSATVFISAITNRSVSGQVQVKSATTGQTSAATFTAINPQGPG